MPRRRASKVSSPLNKRKKNSSIRRWENREDIPLDEVDEFHEQRDKILLDGEGEQPDIDYDDDEVFALKGLAESEEDEDEAGGVDYEDEEDEEMEEPKVQKRKTKGKEKGKSGKRDNKPDESSSEEKSEDEEEESWGLKKSAYYSSNAAQIESDDEEAREMEEQEARRLQAKLRAPMREEDFGYNEALQSAADLRDVDNFWKQEENPKSIAVETDRASILRHLQKTSPETLALAFEWEDIACSVVKMEKKLSEITDDNENELLGLIHLHHQTLLTYAALLAFYLHLRSLEKYAARPELLRQHPILKRLLTLKQSLIMFEELDDEMNEIDNLLTTRNQELSVGELEQLLSEATTDLVKSDPKLDAKAKVEQPPKKKRKSSDVKTTPKVKFDVEEPTLPKTGSSSASGKKSLSMNVFGFGEATTLDDADMADKNVRRKALRFHTAKIESSSARRANARNALGGDDDVPYRERKKEAEKPKRSNLGAGGADLDDAEPEVEAREEPRKRGKDENSDEGSEAEDDDDDDDDDDDGYYSLIKRRKKEKKAEKKAQYEAMKEANRVDLEDDTISGQRSITRAILANKGLTPKRSKSVRNPRVKKRQKFEKAKKKLASQKAIYKGDIGDANHYGGEKSGISKVVKSVKL